MKVKPVNLILLITLVLTLSSVRQAQAKDLLKVTIVGPGLEDAVELTDAESLNVFGKLEIAKQIDKPSTAETEPFFQVSVTLGTGKEIETSYLYQYYPALEGQPGFVYYPDVANVMSDLEGHYFLLSEGTDQVLGDHLTALGASLSGRSNQPDMTLNLPLPLQWLIVALCCCIGIGIAVSLKRFNSAKTGS